jgi:hypothetical protein
MGPPADGWSDPRLAAGQGPGFAQPGWGPPPPPKKKRSVGRFLLIGVGVFVLFIVVVTIANSGGGGATGTSAASSTGPAAAAGEAPAGGAPAGGAPAGGIQHGEDASVTGCEPDEAGWAAATVTVKNNSSKPSNYVITVVMESADGATQIGSGLVAVNNLAPGQQSVEHTSSIKDATTAYTCKITDIARYAS